VIQIATTTNQMQHSPGSIVTRVVLWSDTIRARFGAQALRLRGPARLAGIVVVTIALGFVGYHAYLMIARAPSSYFTAVNGLRIAVGTAVYVVACLIAAWAWVLLLNGLSNRKLAIREGITIYAVTQILKYLPSNVLHAVGRHTMTRRLGIGHSAIAISIAGEILLMAAAAISVAALTSDAWQAAIERALIAPGVGGMAFVAAVPLLAFLALGWIFGGSFTLRAAASYALFLMFFAISGAICVYLLLGADWAIDPLRVRAIFGAVAVAWIAGWITPGASAGLGVREAIIILLLRDEVGIYDASYLALAYRLSTTGGNLAFALLGLVARGRNATFKADEANSN
jgi:hypothetical protein